MIITNFEVTKRKISQINKVPLTGTYNIDTFKFKFDEEWEGLDKTLVIVGTETYNVSLLNDECIVPMELYEMKGTISIGLFGIKDEEKVLATGLFPIYVEKDAYEVGKEPSNLPTQSQWEIYIEQINGLLHECEAQKEQCENILAEMQLLKQGLDDEVAEIERKLADGEFKGDKGDKGEKGDTGPQGPKGEKGDKGDQGVKGEQGIQGEKGDKGDKGDTGAQGPQGEKGEKGDKGDAGDTGAQGPQGEKGEKGDKGDAGDTAPYSEEVEGKRINITNSTNAKLKDIVIYGDTEQNGTPTPDSPVDIKVVTGDVTFNVTTGNMYNNEYEYDGYVLTAGGAVSAETGFIISKAIKIDSTKYISINWGYGQSGYNRQMRVGFFDQNFNFISRPYSSDTPYKLSPPNNAKFIKLSYDKRSLKNVQVVQGQSQLLSLGNIELAKIGNYQDKIYYNSENGKWYKHKEVEKIASYNGEEITTDYISTTGGLSIGATVYYVLLTPINEEITDTTLLAQLNTLLGLKTYKNITNVYTTTDNLEPTLGIKYYRYVNDDVDDLIHHLQSEIPQKTSDLTNDSNFISSTVITAFWKGTQTEYDNLGTYSNTTLYLIEEE